MVNNDNQWLIYIYIYLVGGLEPWNFEWLSHPIGNHNPTWLSYFSEGWVYHQPVCICITIILCRLCYINIMSTYVDIISYYIMILIVICLLSLYVIIYICVIVIFYVIVIYYYIYNYCSIILYFMFSNIDIILIIIIPIVVSAYIYFLAI